MTDSPAALPSVGRVVHYVSYGTPGGEFPSVCRLAFVTELADTVDPGTAGLMVANPTGLFFRPLAEGGCNHDAGDPAEDAAGARCVSGERAYHAGTWHWPERV